jgi:3-deoxy-manno-octulosonate cytidylyltransferase (CMP-KDO synthetase)
MDDVLILIPARLASTRLPGKPLADIAGLPMIVHVLRRAEEAKIGSVAVATDDETIFTAVEKAGGRAVMTRADHVSGSDRIFEALGVVDPQGRARIVINVQGDLPTLAPGDLKAAAALLADPAVDIATLAAEIRTDREWTNPSVVKVTGRWVGPARLDARVFTRSVTSQKRELQQRTATRQTTSVPGVAYARATPRYFHHIGLYAYRRRALQRFVELPPSKNEKEQNLEQLRALDDGMRIDVAIVDAVPLGVDTPEDLETARAMLR